MMLAYHPLVIISVADSSAWTCGFEVIWRQLNRGSNTSFQGLDKHKKTMVQVMTVFPYKLGAQMYLCTMSTVGQDMESALEA